MVRSPCCDKMGVKKGPWTAEEDHILISYIQQHGHGNWRVLPKQAGLLRCGKSCRLRWTNYLRPDIKRGNFSEEEEETIIKLHQMLGNRWSAIAGRLPGRTDNEIKNVWHSHLKKKLRNHLPNSNNNDQSIIVPNRYSSSSIESKPMESQNPNPPEIESRRPRYAPVSSQSSSGNLLSEIKDEQTESSDAFPQFSETFPAGKSMSDSDFFGFTDGFEFRFPLSPATTNSEQYIFGIDDSMEFWYNLLVSAGGHLPELQAKTPLKTLLSQDC